MEKQSKQISFFEKYLSVWVALVTVVGVLVEVHVMLSLVTLDNKWKY
jgi:ACR3 family arsenite efflux pump ArsB